MSTSDNDLIWREQREYFQRVIDSNADLKEAIDKLIDKTVPFSDKVEVVNQPDSMKIENMDDFREETDVLKQAIVDAIIEHAYRGQDSIRVSNPVEAVSVKNLKDVPTNTKELKAIQKALESLDLNVVVEKQNVEFPTSPNKPMSVRLSDGKSFYRATFTSISNAMQEVDPLVGYQPSDKDTSSNPKYYGFIRKDGSWYIMQENTTNGTYRYCWGSPKPNGGGLYIDAWTDRANLTYDYFNEAY